MKSLYKKYGKSKVYFGILIILIIINIAFLNLAYQMKISFSIDGEKFKYVSHTEKLILLQDSKGNEVKVDIANRNHHPLLIAEKYDIEYRDKVISVDHSDWMGEGSAIKLSDGSIYKQKFYKLVVINDRHQTKTHLPFNVQLVNNIQNVYDFVSVDGGGLLKFLILSIPLIFLGLAGVIYPEALWRFNHILSVENGEPTGFAIVSNIIGGIMVICFALLMPFFL